MLEKMVRLDNAEHVANDLDATIADLKQGASKLLRMSLEQRRQLVDACADNIPGVARQWVSQSCQAKRIAVDDPVAAEEILGGPATLLRYLRLISLVYQDVQSSGQPRLPARIRRNGQGGLCVPILPIRKLFDQLVFRGLKAEVWFPPGVTESGIFSELNRTLDRNSPSVCGVLGAGNVSSIPATDMLHKVFCDREAVLLKLNPVNEYLGPVFRSAFKPLIDANLLRVVRGGGELGNAMINHPGVDAVHITGSHLTHDKIVWGSEQSERDERRQSGRPRLAKRITSELGNVTPWIVVPGEFSRKDLLSQAEHIAASIVNNASFNCLSTKMIITSRHWPQRDQFLGMIESVLNRLKPRYAYYPGARERFAAASGKPAPENDGALPWTLIRDADQCESEQLFSEESFVCVCAETALDAQAESEFLAAAVKFANEQLFGTLCASITVTDQFRKRQRNELELAIGQLRYGSVCVNQWSGVMYGLMSPPWGGYPCGTLEKPYSGIGHVHNTFGLQGFEKSVLWGPLRQFPKPVWYPTHKTAQHGAWSLLRLYQKPTITRIPRLLYHAVRGSFS
jgi:hypothetical protein